MKQTIKNTKMIALGLFTFCAMGLTKTTFANNETDSLAMLTYIGKIKNQPVFQLNLNNKEPEVFYIDIKNQNGDILYSEKIHGEHLSRKYQLDIDEMELNDPGFGLQVEVTSTKTHETIAYRVSSHASVTRSIVVAKL